jgi:hypothetical protein
VTRAQTPRLRAGTVARRTAEARTCIYCLRPRPVSSFNREHVLLKALGRFRGSLVIRSACRQCNQYFGDSVDRIFARGSLEAVLRFEIGLKPAEEITDLISSRVAFTFPSGSYRGLWLEPISDNGRIVLRPLAQAGFATRSGGWLYITAHALDRLTALPAEADVAGLKRVLAPTAEGYDQVLALLRRLGVNFTSHGPLPNPEGWGEVEPEIKAEVDLITRQCVAKMAFNYMACTLGAGFAFREDFNDVRSFARHATGPSYEIVTESQTPILADDERSRRQTYGHLIVIQWDNVTGELVSLFSPFNEMTYRIVLCRHFSGIWRPISVGHHYDLGAMTVGRLFGSSLKYAR